MKDDRFNYFSPVSIVTEWSFNVVEVVEEVVLIVVDEEINDDIDEDDNDEMVVIILLSFSIIDLSLVKVFDSLATLTVEWSLWQWLCSPEWYNNI